MIAPVLAGLLLYAVPDADAPSRLFDAASCGLRRSIAPLGGDIYSLSFSADGTRLAAGCGTTVRVYDTRTWAEAMRLEGHPEEIMGVACRPDGRRVAAGGFQGTLVIWDAATGKIVSRHKAHPALVSVVAYNPDGTLLYSAGHDGSVKRWEPRTDTLLETVRTDQGRITSLSFSRDGKRFATTGSNGKVKVWDATSMKEVRAIVGAWGARAVSFSRDGRRISIAELQGIRVCGLAAGEPDTKLVASVGSVNGAVFLPDDRHLIYGGSEGITRVWDMKRRKVVFALKHHDGAINAVAIPAHGRFFVTAGMDRHLKIWGRTGGAPRIRPKGFCGIRVRDTPGGGVTVAEVIEDSAAEKAGLKFNDKIKKVGGVAVSNSRESVAKISSYFAGDTVVFELTRGGKEMTIRVTLGTRPPDVP